jgi:superfamily II DNA or RNA helicase
MALCKLVIVDEVNIKLVGLPVELRRKLANAFKYEVPGAKFTPAVKLGRWDGTVSLFGIHGFGFLSQLPRILEILQAHDYEISEIEDRRHEHNIKFNEVSADFWGDRCWPRGHILEGKPIVLRDYQVEAVNNFIRSPQGIQVISTGAGKCLHGATAIPVHIAAFGYVDMKFLVLANLVERITSAALEDNNEVDISYLGVQVLTPRGYVPVNYIIKKTGLPVVRVQLTTGYSFVGANKHIVQYYGDRDVFLEDLRPNDTILHMDGVAVVASVTPCGTADCFDIGIASPHLYYDSNGVVHHNTIICSTLVKICEPIGRTITIVPNKSLVEQTFEDYDNCGLDVGVYYGDKKDIGKTHTICTWQSLGILDKKSKDSEEDAERLAGFLQNMNTVIVDECHGAKANLLHKLLTNNVNHAPVRWGLTGTLPKHKYEYESLFASLGPVIDTIRASDLQDQGVLSSCHINIMQLIDIAVFKEYNDELTYLVSNQERIAYIAKLIEKISASGNTLVLVGRIDSGEQLASLIPDSTFVSGAVTTKDRKTEYDEVKVSTNKVLIATAGVAAVGINIVKLHNIVLLEPGKSFVRVIQSIGRGLRKGDGKDHVEVWDITSTCKFAKRHLSERKKFYDEANYKFSLKKIDWN